MHLYAQYNMPQNDAWVFATVEGLNFLPGPNPVSIFRISHTQEGSASVSDNSGNLLFYTEGINTTIGAKVYDRTGAVMPHGSAIVPFATFSCTQAAAIVPVIGNPNQYYVFSLEQGGDYTWYVSTAGLCHLSYCIVDMTLNGGLGDVIASTLATPLDSGLCEKMTVVAGDSCNIWLLAHEKNAPVFKAYSITGAGISAPVVSSATGEIPTGIDAYKIGTIKVSPDRTMIANCVMNGSYGGVDDRLELLRFNATTGLVTGCQVINNFVNQYDAEFSPDNSKLYVHIMGSSVYQYDLSLLPSIAAVISSQFLVYTSPDWGGQMKLGPNGKIYIQTGSGFLDCINSPNLSGSLCNYIYYAIRLAGGALPYELGMPNMQIVANLTDTITTHTDSTVCALAGTITLNAPYGYVWYIWNNGNTTPSVTVADSGIFWVKTARGCNLQVDTFNIRNTAPSLIPIVTDTGFCTGASVILNAPTGYTAHVWNTGVTTASVTATTAGTYWVADTNLAVCTLQTDTFHVTTHNPVLIPIVTDTGFCTGTSVILNAPTGYTAHVWNTGVTTSSIIETTAGTYWVTDTDLSTCIIMTDTFNVTITQFPLIVLGKDTTICPGDSITLSSPVSVGTFLWNTGSTAPSITVPTAGTYYLTVINQGCSTTDTIKISQLSAPSPIILGSDTILCKGDMFILSSSPDKVLWSTGIVADSIIVTDSGPYSATVTNTCGSLTSTINVSFEPCDLYFPNAFTPNNDGRNDIARAVGYLSAFRNYTLSIYNRWGQRVFYTEDIYAGWNGKFNDVPQDLDTYFYMITYTLNGKHGMLKGDLTLIR
jgi:gliding motility-associated-like protein